MSEPQDRILTVMVMHTWRHEELALLQEFRPYVFEVFKSVRSGNTGVFIVDAQGAQKKVEKSVISYLGFPS